MLQDDFAIYFVVFDIVFYGIPILLLVFLGIKLSRSWQILSIKQRRLVISLMPLSVAVSFVLGFVAIAHSTQSIYGILQLFLALIANLALVIVLTLFGSLIRRFESDTNRSKFSYGMIGIFLLASLSYSPLMSRGITDICDGIQQDEVIPLIEAMEVYRHEKGFYPEDFSDVSPNYIQQIPQPFCLKPYAWFNAFVYYPSYTILQCKNEPALVVFSSPDVQSVHIYNSSTKEWRVTDYYDIYYNESCH